MWKIKYSVKLEAALYLLILLSIQQSLRESPLDILLLFLFLQRQNYAESCYSDKFFSFVRHSRFYARHRQPLCSHYSKFMGFLENALKFYDNVLPWYDITIAMCVYYCDENLQFISDIDFNIDFHIFHFVLFQVSLHHSILDLVI